MFVQPTAREFRAREWRPESETRDVRSHLGSKIAGWALYPFYLLGRFVEWNSGGGRGRWPTPSSKIRRNLIYSVIGLLGGIRPWLFGIFVCWLVGLGAWKVVGSITSSFLRMILATNWHTLNPMSRFHSPRF